MEDSILVSVKKILDIPESNTAFDLQILIHINSAFGTLHQLGVGPESVFEIQDDSAVWADFILEKPEFNSVKTYVALVVKTIFDPPTSSYAVAAMEKQIMEFGWRLNAAREHTDWVAPVLP